MRVQRQVGANNNLRKVPVKYRHLPKLGALRCSSVHPKKGPWDTHWRGQNKGAHFIGPSAWTHARRARSAGGRRRPPRWVFVKAGLAESVDTGDFYNYTSHSRGSMPSILAPADSPSEEQFTLGSIAAELELEPRRANLLGAFDDADDANGQDDLAPDAADGAAA